MSNTAVINRPSLTAEARSRWLEPAITLPNPGAANSPRPWAMPRFDDVAALANRIALGEANAIALLGQALFPPMIRLARALSPQHQTDAELATGMVSTVIKRIQRRPSHLATLDQWAVKAAIRFGFRETETERRRRDDAAGSPGELEDFRHLVEEGSDRPSVDADTARKLLSQVLARLKPRHRFIISMMEIQGATIEEIADLAGWPHWLTRLRAFHARQAFDRGIGSLAPGKNGQ